MIMSQAAKAQQFRALHEAPDAFVIANVWDGGSARMMAALGFAALATSSGASAGLLGRRDGRVTRDEALAQARVICDATDLPVSADLEKGFGDAPEIVAETIRLAAEAGLAGCSIEDATGNQDAPIFELRQATERIAAAAEMFLAAGAHYVVPDFAWVQDVGGNLMVPADQVCRAVAWVYRNAARFDGDSNRLYIGGQSSGGHLAAVALTTDWQCQFNLPADIIKGGMCISGMYDLTPVRLSARSRYVAFDDATVDALSSLRYLDRLHAPLVVAYGTCETPEFQRQNREFAAAVEASGKVAELLVGEHYNHFELPETLGNPYGLLGRAALDLMRLASVCRNDRY